MNVHTEYTIPKFRRLRRDEAPHLFDCVEKLAKKAGVDKINLHWHDKNEISPFVLELGLGSKLHLPETVMGAVGGKGVGNTNHIIIGNEIAGVLGFDHLKSTVSPEMEAVLAHEISHLKHDKGPFGAPRMAKLSPWAGVAAGIAAMYLVRHYNKSKEEQLKDPDHKELSLTNEKGELNLPPKEEQATTMGNVATVAKYMAAAAVGLAAGHYGAKLIRQRMEYRADRFAAELMGDAKPMQSALQKLVPYIEKKHEEIFGRIKNPTLKKAVKKINDFCLTFLHPPLPKRIERLGGFTP